MRVKALLTNSRRGEATSVPPTNSRRCEATSVPPTNSRCCEATQGLQLTAAAMRPHSASNQQPSLRGHLSASY